ncbi:MAG TPA: riboflavin synthase [bacterium]|nr:riboflavin synthase [bacterium]
MFTGLIEEIGILDDLVRRGDRYDITVRASTVTEDLAVDDSVNINGVCLTVVETGPNYFHVQVVPQTVRKSTFSRYQPGEQLNLERALAAGDRFGGHFVQGHVDGTAALVKFHRQDDHAVLGIRPGRDLLRYCVNQGSIAVDGISLTIASLQADTIEIAAIPHTMRHTNLQHKQVGDAVNIEVDMLSKYVEHHLERHSTSRMTFDWLTEQGY